MRKELDLFANVRPVRIPDQGIDWTFFRENTEGSYAVGKEGVHVNEDLCIDFTVVTQQGTERIIKAAFDFAKKNGKTRVTAVTKANWLPVPNATIKINNSGSAESAYWFYVKIWQRPNEMVRDMMPCVLTRTIEDKYCFNPSLPHTEGTVGMIDLNTNKFFTSNNGVPFQYIS